MEDGHLRLIATKIPLSRMNKAKQYLWYPPTLPWKSSKRSISSRGKDLGHLSKETKHKMSAAQMMGKEEVGRLIQKATKDKVSAKRKGRLIQRHQANMSALIETVCDFHTVESDRL